MRAIGWLAAIRWRSTTGFGCDWSGRRVARSKIFREFPVFPGTNSTNMPLSTAERNRLILQALTQMDKQFGKGTVLQLGSRNVVPVTVIPTWALSVDAA